AAQRHSVDHDRAAPRGDHLGAGRDRRRGAHHAARGRARDRAAPAGRRVGAGVRVHPHRRHDRLPDQPAGHRRGAPPTALACAGAPRVNRVKEPGMPWKPLLRQLWLPVLVFVLLLVGTARSTNFYFPPLRTVLATLWDELRYGGLLTDL